MTAQTRRIADRVGRAQEVAASGLEVHRGSDAPGKMALIHSVREARADQGQYDDNAMQAMQLLNVADQSLSGLAGVLSAARELAVQMSSETYNATSRISSAAEANGLVDRAIMFANGNLAGRYVFAGEAYDGAAYDETTGAYLGNTDEPETAVADNNQTVLTGFDGSNLLQGTGDIITAVQDLETALATGVATNVQAILTDIDAAVEQLAVARTVVGGEMIRAEDGSEMALNMGIALGAQESVLVDADAVEAFTNLFQVQQSFEAALQVTANARSSLLFSRL
jgi:flagellar hook-associated protein 3 FlgL